MTEFFKHYNLKITTLSPVHIGTGFGFDPTNFIISLGDEKPIELPKEQFYICPECGYKNKTNASFCLSCDSELPLNEIKKETNITSSNQFLYTFSSSELAKALGDKEKQELLNISKTGNIQQVQQFFKKYAHLIQKHAKKKAIVSKDIAKNYQEKLGNAKNKNEINRFDIERTYCETITQNPVLLGSSLKGSLRTGLLNYNQSKKHIQRNDVKKIINGKEVVLGTDIEKKLLDYDKVEKDPMKYIKISDFIAESQITTLICNQSYKKKKTDKDARGPSSMLEIIPKGSVFTGSINLMSAENINITIGGLKTVCNQFYKRQFEKEKLTETRVGYVKPSFYSEAEEMIQRPNSFLMRIGKHSGAESVTIDEVRSIKIMGKKGEPPKYLPETTTFWFADDGDKLEPFGWILVEFTEG